MWESYNEMRWREKPLAYGRKDSMQKLALSLIAATGLVLMAAPASAHYGEYCGYRWSPYWNQWVYRCVRYHRPYYQPYYRPYYRPYPNYSHPYYPYPYSYPYSYPRHYYPYGPSFQFFFGLQGF